jgi:integrase/recombinase XerD
MRLREALEEYLKVRRMFGFKLRIPGSLLQKFVSYVEGEGASYITRELAVRWATQPKNCQPANWAKRLSMVRSLARYLSATDPRTEIPPGGLLPYRFARKTPYLYTDEEIACLIEAAEKLPPPRGLRAATYATLFGLLAVTGMRMSEPIVLNRDQVDLARGILTIRRTKFGKSRIIPIHASTLEALQRYAELRDRLCPWAQTESFFISERGTRLERSTVHRTFIHLSRQIGLRGPDASRGPRLHDLRHGFAIETLLRWYRAGVDVEQHLPELSTYLGHTRVAGTYWYITAVPELLRLATLRLEKKGGKRR